eukprot:SAG11_NODE_15783_length_566_cov_1.760171_2_plen_69_part_00
MLRTLILVLGEDTQQGKEHEDRDTTGKCTVRHYAVVAELLAAQHWYHGAAVHRGIDAALATRLERIML